MSLHYARLFKVPTFFTEVLKILCTTETPLDYIICGTIDWAFVGGGFQNYDSVRTFF